MDVMRHKTVVDSAFGRGWGGGGGGGTKCGGGNAISSPIGSVARG